MLASVNTTKIKSINGPSHRKPMKSIVKAAHVKSFAFNLIDLYNDRKAKIVADKRIPDAVKPSNKPNASTILISHLFFNLNSIYYIVDFVFIFIIIS